MDKHRGGAARVISQVTESRWREALAQVGQSAPGGRSDSSASLGNIWTERSQVEVRYHINLRESRLRDRLVIDLVKIVGEGRTEPVELEDGDPSGLTPIDAEIVSLLFGAQGEARTRGVHAPDTGLSRCSVRPSLYRMLLPKLCESGRLYADLTIPGVAATGPLRFEASRSLSVRLVVAAPSPDDNQKNYRLWGVLAASGARYDLEAPKILLSDGLALVDGALYIVDSDERLAWALRLRRHGAVEFPEEAKDSFLLELASMPDLPELELPPELHWSQVEVAPRPKVVLSLEEEPGTEESASEARAIPPYLLARICFDYGDFSMLASSRDAAVVDQHGRRLFRRDLVAEHRHLKELRSLELQAEPGAGLSEIRLARKSLSESVKALIEAGWSVESDGEIVRSQGKLRAKVSSRIDWFELDAVVDFGGEAQAKLPELLRAAQAGRAWVRLSDGSKGLVPSYVKQYAALARLGKNTGGKLRFLPSQAGVIDVLLAGHDFSEFDLKYERLRDQLASAAQTPAISEPNGFKGKLRDYQRAGVTWMQFLADHHYGGCLADDMGLGKTVQVLCLLQSRHPRGSTEEGAPSLVVVPKSLVHNWVSEADKFTELKVLNYTGAKRGELNFGEYDLIVTTYGTLRQEILQFTEVRFTTLVLDEAQAIKNPRSQAAKVCRILQAKLRLAISGTPIENGLEELWSLFEFLNPGMLGGPRGFRGGG